ncbi:DUF3231 family protein [Neobacillus sp. PS3-12]|uniref:DUF3231 family protein n=1 Tax=Neobacillus sp. PS3-12 TaxID=3070677 RepID=UPI0027E14C20|nr:DUF3231 family protein [Neobacillus sp. PS3-12]WML53179.1 DUF3231 family protein [Neobacillus sp. PS3-12]
MKTQTEPLTAAEMGKLWASYLGNSMGKLVLSYYLKNVEDVEIKKVLETGLAMSQSYVNTINSIFTQADFPIPIAFTDEDVDLDAPRLFYDEFYLHYLQYLGKAGMSIYSVAIPLVTRNNIRDFFVKCLHETSRLMMDVNDILKSKGRLMNAPIVTSPTKVDFIKKQSFLNGFFGEIRTLHGLEVAHLYGNINNDVTSKALIIGFRQVARNEKVKKYLERGERINEKHIQMLSDKLTEDNIPAPSLIDHLVTPSVTPVFSDKLMIFHKIDMFSMKIREYANGLSLNGRRDLGALYAKCQLDVSLYVEDGANIMIEQGWMEQPPEVVNRVDLIHKNENNTQE